MKLLIAFACILLQPVFWFGILRTCLNSRAQTKYSRKQFRTAVFENHFEIKNLAINLFVLGIIVSIFSAFLGLMLPVSWILLYELGLLVNLILIPWDLFPVTIVIGTLIGFSLFDVNSYLAGQFTLPFDMNWQLTSGVNALLLVTLILFATGLFFRFSGGKYNTPRIFRNRRNKRIVGYPFNELSIIPLFILVPGDGVRSIISFWPILSFNGHTFSFIFIPIMVGIKAIIFNDVPKHAFQILSRRTLRLCFLSLILTIISYFEPIIVIYALAFIDLLYWAILISLKHHNNPSSSIYAEVINGVRIVGIKPASPASKMKIEIGDVILDVNGQKVHDENSFYKALLLHPTYCHLRVIDRNKRIKITGTAIYNNSPHELGIVIFED